MKTREKTFFFQKEITSANNITLATYKMAYIQGKKGKPFSNDDIMKAYIVKIVGCLDPDKIEKILIIASPKDHN